MILDRCHSSVAVVIFNTDTQKFVFVQQFRPAVYVSSAASILGGWKYYYAMQCAFSGVSDYQASSWGQGTVLTPPRFLARWESHWSCVPASLIRLENYMLISSFIKEFILVFSSGAE